MGKREQGVKIHQTAIVPENVKIGKGTVIWAYAQIGDNARIGENCVIGNGVYIDRNVIVGNNVKIHNKASIYDGTIIEDDVFIGPHACFTNDKYPRHNATRDLSEVSWRVKKGASIGANVTVLPDVTIGQDARVGAGSVVTKDVPDGALAYGNPARVRESKSQRVKES